MLRVELNGQFIQHEPDGLKDITAEIKLDEELNALVIETPVELTFRGEGYQILRDQFNTLGYCGEVTCNIWRTDNQGTKTTLLYEGIIPLSSCRIHHPQNKIDAVLIDDSWYARIFNNKKIKVGLSTTQAKNSTDTAQINITGATKLTINSSYDLGGTYAYDFNAYDLKEIFELQIKYMSDGELNFESEWYDNLPDDEKTCITWGKWLRDGAGSTQDAPGISFYDLYTDLKRIFNLCIVYRKDSSGTTIKIEDQVFLNNTSSGGFNIDNESYIIIVDEARLFARVLLGNQFDDGTGYDVAPKQAKISFIGILQEEYAVQGTCNIDTELDLRIQNVDTSHNRMYACQVDSNTQYDDRIFIVNYDSSTNNTVLSDPYNENGGTGFMQNELYFNNKIAERYQLQGAIGYHLGGYDGRFTAEGNIGDEVYTNILGSVSTVPPGDIRAEILALDFSTELYDSGTVYDAIDTFTAPANGIYNFWSEMDIGWAARSSICSGLTGIEDSANPLQFTVILQHLNSSNVEIGRIEYVFSWFMIRPRTIYPEGEFYTLWDTYANPAENNATLNCILLNNLERVTDVFCGGAFSMTTGDKMRVGFGLQQYLVDVDYTIRPRLFQCTSSYDGIGKIFGTEDRDWETPQ